MDQDQTADYKTFWSGTKLFVCNLNKIILLDGESLILLNVFIWEEWYSNLLIYLL